MQFFHTPDDQAEQNQERFKELSDARQEWDTHAREDYDFYLGNHFTEQESEALAEMAQADVPFDRIGPAVEQLKSMLTAQPPKFSAIPRESSDAKRAHVWKVLLEYIWDMSNGDEEFKQAVQDYSVMGIGYFYAYIDHQADYGRGEVKFRHLDPFRVFVDPYSSHRYFDDAHDIIITTIMTKRQLLNRYPKLQKVIDRINTIGDDQYPGSTQSDTKSSITPPDIDGLDGKHRTKYRLIERFVKEKANFLRVLYKESGEEQVKSEDDFYQWLQVPGMAEMIRSGAVEVKAVDQTRIRRVATIGDYVVEEEQLPTDRFPVVPVPNIWTRTPYPMGDVRRAKGMQRFLNKMFSITMAHSQASAGLKLLLPSGSVDDIEEFEKRWANPFAVEEYNPEAGEPHFGSVPPLNSNHYALIERAENYIDFIFGIWEMQHGNPEDSPRTASATMMMEDFGQRRTKSKLRDVEASLGRLGKVVHRLAKNHYTYQKTVAIVQPDGTREETKINMPTYDDFSQTLQEIQNSVQDGEEDIRIQKNSTLPSNMWGEVQIHQEMYDRGIIDQVEMLKKLPIYDKEGVLERNSVMSQMQQVIEQQEQLIKDMEGDLQTATRESIHDQKKYEVEKSKQRLKDMEREFKSEADALLNDYQLAVDQARESNGSAE